METILPDYNSKRSQLEAARRALSIINRFEPSEFKAKHTSNIFRRMNQLRREIRQLESQQESKKYKIFSTYGNW